MTVPSRDELDDLLSRGRVSAPRRERIFEKVYRSVHRGGGPFRARSFAFAAPLALAAVLMLLLRTRSEGQRGGYAAKGTAGAQVEMGCLGGELSRCPRGSKLIFRLDAIASTAFLHAYAEPLEPGRERIWYYPTAGNAPPRIDPSVSVQTLPQGVVVGPEHGPGVYRVHVVLASTPLSREELLRSAPRDVVATQVVKMEVVTP